MPSRQPSVPIQLAPEQQQALAEIAQRENRSVSEIVQEMIHAQLEKRKHEKTTGDFSEVLTRIIRHREEILRRRSGKPPEIDPTDLIDQLRDERDAEIVDCATS